MRNHSFKKLRHNLTFGWFFQGESFKAHHIRNNSLKNTYLFCKICSFVIMKTYENTQQEDGEFTGTHDNPRDTSTQMRKDTI